MCMKVELIEALEGWRWNWGREVIVVSGKGVGEGTKLQTAGTSEEILRR